MPGLTALPALLFIRPETWNTHRHRGVRLYLSVSFWQEGNIVNLGVHLFFFTQGKKG